MKVFSAVAIAALSSAAFASDTYTQGYIRSDGTYVQPHYQTAPNNTRTDNYSSQGNTNPYTGQQGHVDQYKQPAPRPYNYDSGQQRKNRTNW
jgi:opacity protein-like surface antigen